MAAGESDILSTLNSEFEKWNEEALESHIYLLEAKEKEDGSASILFSLGGEYEFILQCPRDYPNNQNPFSVEASGNLRQWANALNEFCNDSDQKLRLQNILHKATSLYSSSKVHRESVNLSSEDETLEEEEEESELGVSLTDDDAFITEWELKIARIKKQWTLKENQIRAEMKKNKPSTLQCSVPIIVHDNIQLDQFSIDKNASRQVFSTNASSGILTNDLIAIMENEINNGIFAEPIDNNIYNWCVKLSGFKADSALEGDLRVINTRFGYNYLEFQLEFTMDLYPFYPPLVKVVRPRLQPAMMQRVTNMELLKLSYWNPARDMMSVLLEVKEFVEEWARLDLDTRRNNLQLRPQGAYLEIEHHLLRLAMVSEVCPRANLQFTLEKGNILPTNSPQMKKMKSYWAAGTGYGTGSTERDGWDPKAHLAAQKLKDKQIVGVLQRILYELKQYSSTRTSSMSVDGPSVNGNSNVSSDVEIPMEICESLETNENSDSAISVDIGTEGSSSSSFETSMCCLEEELYEIIEASALIPFLESHLRTSSFLEICRHSALYNAIIQVIKELSRISRLVLLLGSLSNQENSIVECLHQLKEQASDLILRIGKGAANGSIPHLMPQQKNNPQQDPTEEKIAKEFSTLHELVVSSMQQHCKDTTSCASTSSDSVNVTGQLPDETLYLKSLKHLQFQNNSFASAGSFAHLFARAFVSATAPTPNRVFRIAQELSSLSSSLPLNLSSSIFVRADEEKCTLLRVLITGPEDTPYSGGCYLFDVFFPERYPSVAPMVQLRTTGKGTVRFNPNLYSCGKVCLSLLGTWVGQPGEGWNSESSTILQVLVSIQSLILVSEPFFNEPGFEIKIGTDEGKRLSASYNEEVRINNIKWAMLDQLVNPCPGFEDVISLHFFIKKKRILQDINQWLRESTNVSRFTKAIENLEKELCKLQSRSDLQEKIQSFEDLSAIKL